MKIRIKAKATRPLRQFVSQKGNRITVVEFVSDMGETFTASFGYIDKSDLEYWMSDYTYHVFDITTKSDSPFISFWHVTEKQATPVSDIIFDS